MSQETEVGRPQPGVINYDFGNPNSDPFNGIVTSPVNNQQDPEIQDAVIDQEQENSGNTDPVTENGNTSTEDTATGQITDAPEVEHEEEPNIYPYIGEQLKKDGFIDSEITFDEKVDGMTVYNAYKDKLKKETEPLIRQEAINNLLEQGFDENDLLIARAIRQGVDYRLLSQNSRYEIYANLADTAPDEDKVSIISQMYRERGLDESEVKDQIAIAEQNDRVGELFTKSKEFFSRKYNDFKESEDRRSKEVEANLILEVKKADELVNRVTTSQELYGEKLTPTQVKELNDAIRATNELVEVDGVKYRASELQKFMIDFNSNPEFRLFAFKLFKFRDIDKNLIKEDAKKELDKQLFEGYTQKVIQSKKYSSNKQVTEQLEQQKNNNNLFGRKMNIDLG